MIVQKPDLMKFHCFYFNMLPLQIFTKCFNKRQINQGEQTHAHAHAHTHTHTHTSKYSMEKHNTTSQ